MVGMQKNIVFIIFFSFNIPILAGVPIEEWPQFNESMHPYTQKQLLKKQELKKIITERLTAVQNGSKNKSYLDEPVKPGTHFYKTLLTKAVRHSLDEDSIKFDGDLFKDEIYKLLQAGANPLYQGMGGPLGEATNTSMAQLLLSYSNSPEKYKIAFSAFITWSFDKWGKKERNTYLAWLLEQGVNPNEEVVHYTNLSHSSLPLVCLAGKVHYCKKKEIKDDIALCIQKGADPNKKDTSINRSVSEFFRIENPDLVKFMQEERAKYEQTV